MKLKTFLFMASLLLVGGMVMTSCSKDDDNGDKPINGSIVGAWTTGITETGWTAKTRGVDKLKGPQKTSELPTYYQRIFYYTSTEKIFDIWAYYDKDKKLMEADVYTGIYTVTGNKVEQHFAETDTEMEFKVEKDKITFSWEEGGETVNSSYSKMDKKEVQPLLDNSEKKLIAEGVLGVWGLYDDNYGYYINNNEYERIWKIYYNDGKVDLLTLYYNDDYTWKKSTVLHGTWTIKDFVLHEDFKGQFKNDFLINMSSSLYLTEYYIDGKGNRKVFEYALFLWEEDKIKDLYDMAEELN